MELLKPFILLISILILIKLKLPLWGAVLVATIEAALLYTLPVGTAVQTMAKAAVSQSTIELVLVTYLLILMQKLMEKRNMLVSAEKHISALICNPRIKAAAIPMTMGLLPSPGAVLIAGSMMENSDTQAISREDLAFITSYYRHIPEALLPVYTNVILICAISGVPEWQFVLAMLPYTILNITVPAFIFLRKIPKGKREKPTENMWMACLQTGRNLWPILMVILLILAFQLKAVVACIITMLLFVWVEKFQIKELKKPLIESLDKNMLPMVVAIMVFTSVIGMTGLADSMYRSFQALPIPAFLMLALVFFLGCVCSNFTAMIPVTVPAAIAVCPSPLAITVLLASMGHLASQLCPTHICILLCCNYYRVKLTALIKRTLPVVLVMIAVSLILYLLMIHVFIV